MSQNIEAKRQEATDGRIRMDAVLTTMRKDLSNSALVSTDKEPTEADVHIARDLLLDVAPYASRFIHPSYWDHVLTTSIYQRLIAKYTGENPHEAEARGLLHDLGKLGLPNRYGMEWHIEDRLFEKAGVSEDFQGGFFPVEQALRSEGTMSVDDFSLTQITNDAVDNLAKRNPDGSLKTVEQTVNHIKGQIGRYGGVDATWERERGAKESLIFGGKQQEFLNLFVSEVELLKERYGVDFETLREEVEREYQRPENQAYLGKLKNAQETLDPAVDEKLERPAIKTIVFDVGGVLLNVTDEKIAQAIAEKTGHNAETILTALSSLYDKAMAGEMDDETFIRSFHELSGIPFTSIEESRALLHNPEIFSPTAGMQDVVNDLIGTGKANVAVLSDVIGVYKPSAIDALRTHYPGISLGNYFASCDLGATKRHPDAPAFGKMLGILQERQDDTIDPETMVFVDDNEEYAARARKQGLRGMTFRGDQSEGISATERLKGELELAHLT